MKNVIILFGFIYAVIIPEPLSAQITLDRAVIGSAGLISSSSNIRVSYTIGEPVVNFSTTSTAILSAGFQQYDFNLSSGLDEINTGLISIYPNPTRDIIYYDIKAVEELELTVTVYDMSGREVLSTAPFSIINSHLGKLSLESLPAGIWTLVFNAPADSYAQTFRIIKLE